MIDNVRKMKIALLQTNIIWENKRENGAHYTALLASMPDDVRLVILPEMFFTGFSMYPERLAETGEGATLEWLCKTAMHKQAALVGSVITGERGRYYNRLYFVFPDGTYKRYDKRHLFSMGEEHRHYEAGTERLVVDYEGGRICPLVCYDLRFPVFSRNYGEAYDLLLYVANWPASRIHAWNTLLAARAIENQCYVAGVNRIGSDGGGVAHNGYSQVVDFKGRVVAGANEEEAIFTAELSLEGLRDFRKQFPALKDADKFSIS